MQLSNIAVKKLCGIYSYIMNEVGFCPVVSGVLSSGVLSKLGAKIPKASSFTFTRNHTKLFSFKANLTLKVKVEFTGLQTHLRHIDDQ